jgi:hypothetical protein
MVANGTNQPLQTAPAWQHRYPATNALAEYSIVATTANVEFEVTSGSEVLVQRGPVPGGGTAGVYPNFQDVKDMIGVYAGQELAFTLFEVGGAAATVMLEVHLNPI